jgi:hypothetical protein
LFQLNIYELSFQFKNVFGLTEDLDTAQGTIRCHVEFRFVDHAIARGV